jgi:hypothetical protein
MLPANINTTTTQQQLYATTQQQQHNNSFMQQRNNNNTTTALCNNATTQQQHNSFMQQHNGFIHGMTHGTCDGWREPGPLAAGCVCHGPKETGSVSFEGGLLAAVYMVSVSCTHVQPSSGSPRLCHIPHGPCRLCCAAGRPPLLRARQPHPRPPGASPAPLTHTLLPLVHTPLFTPTSRTPHPLRLAGKRCLFTYPSILRIACQPAGRASRPRPATPRPGCSRKLPVGGHPPAAAAVARQQQQQQHQQHQHQHQQHQVQAAGWDWWAAPGRRAGAP